MYAVSFTRQPLVNVCRRQCQVHGCLSRELRNKLPERIGFHRRAKIIKEP